jgi:hypothetical protein
VRNSRSLYYSSYEIITNPPHSLLPQSARGKGKKKALQTPFLPSFARQTKAQQQSQARASTSATTLDEDGEGGSPAPPSKKRRKKDLDPAFNVPQRESSRKSALAFKKTVEEGLKEREQKRVRSCLLGVSLCALARRIKLAEADPSPLTRARSRPPPQNPNSNRPSTSPKRTSSPKRSKRKRSIGPLSSPSTPPKKIVERLNEPRGCGTRLLGLRRLGILGWREGRWGI